MIAQVDAAQCCYFLVGMQKLQIQNIFEIFHFYENPDPDPVPLLRS